MRKFKFNKLVRDGIRKSCEANGAKVVWRKLSDAEYLQELKLKLAEEVAEFNAAPAGKLLNELADLQEVINSLLVAIAKTPAELEAQRAKRASEVGSFAAREFIEHVEVPDDPQAYPYTDYYLANSDKYPEIAN